MGFPVLTVLPVRMDKQSREEIRKILDGLQCPKDFACYTSGLKNFCEAMDIGLQAFLLCLESSSKECKFSVGYGDKYFCQCPLRVYIAKNYRSETFKG